MLSKDYEIEMMEEFNFEIIVKMLFGNASPKEEKIFDLWYNNSEENQAYFSDIKLVFEKSKESSRYSRFDMEKAWGQITKKAAINGKNSKQKLLSKKSVSLLFKYAAFFVLTFVLGGLAHYLFSKFGNTVEGANKNYYSISAPLGSKTKVELPDSTIVWLNSGSEIKYPGIFAEDEREVFLTGEAYFDVKKKSKIPFFVNTKNINIKVLGTKFNVKAYSEEGTVETVLEEGLINIGRVGDYQNLLLKPNEKAIYIKKYGKINDSDPRLDQIRLLKPKDRVEQFIVFENVDTKLNTSWKENELRFKSESFENLAFKLERWYNVKFHIENESIKTQQFTGSFTNQSIEQVMKALQITVKFSYKIDKNNVWIN